MFPFEHLRVAKGLQFDGCGTQTGTGLVLVALYEENVMHKRRKTHLNKPKTLGPQPALDLKDGCITKIICKLNLSTTIGKKPDGLPPLQGVSPLLLNLGLRLSPLVPDVGQSSVADLETGFYPARLRI
ncbi:hypothetical protein C8J57DRAFT_1258060 [Mycena rebaudengoi]|jgi:hypothetical protein|nr:hypothetical protein C8J57DRAFT_1258060 [Mycena rebaudengoi]